MVFAAGKEGEQSLRFLRPTLTGGGVNLQVEFNGFEVSLTDTSIIVEDSGFSVAVNPVSKDLDPDIVIVTSTKSSCLDQEILQEVEGSKTVSILPKNVEAALQEVESLVPGDIIDVYGVEIEAVRGEGLGYRLSMGEAEFFVAEKGTPRTDLKDLEGRVDTAFLPFGENGMDLEEAIQAAVRIKPDVVIPYRSQDAPVRKLKAELEDRSIQCRLPEN